MRRARRGTPSRKVRQISFAAAVGVLLLALAGGAGAALIGEEEWSPERVEEASQGMEASELAVVEELAGAPEERRLRVRTDLERLADAWASVGGSDGYPFWEKAWRSYGRGEIAASSLRDYTVSYRELLERGSGVLASRNVDTQVARVVRGQLVRALELRVDALGLLAEYLDQKRGLGEADDSEDLHRTLDRATEQLQASYRATRLAMNTSQAALAATGQPPLSESSFL